MSADTWFHPNLMVNAQQHPGPPIGKVPDPLHPPLVVDSCWESRCGQAPQAPFSEALCPVVSCQLTPCWGPAGAHLGRGLAAP